MLSNYYERMFAFRCDIGNPNLALPREMAVSATPARYVHSAMYISTEADGI